MAALAEEHGNLLGETDPGKVHWLMSKMRRDQGDQGLGLLPWATHYVIMGKSLNFSMPDLSPSFSKDENLSSALALLQICSEEDREVISMKILWEIYIIYVKGNVTVHVFRI